MSRSPAELAREVRDWLIVLLIVLRENRPEKERAIAALAELEAQAEAGRRLQAAVDRAIAIGELRLLQWEAICRSIPAAAAPSPADQHKPGCPLSRGSRKED